MRQSSEPPLDYVPNRELAEVPSLKIPAYLLNPEHPDGAPKAAFFFALGFNRSDPDRLIRALLDHVRLSPASEINQVQHGTMYTVDSPMPCPDGRSPRVRSVWIIEPPSDRPRFVTAYPAPRPRLRPSE